MSGAAIVVLLMGVFAARRPDKGIDHYIPTQYLAPVLTAVGTILAGGAVWWSVGLGDRLVKAAISTLTLARDGHWKPVVEEAVIPAVNLFVTRGGHAQITMDPFAAILGFVAFAGTLIVMLASLEHFGEHQIHKAEYYSLLMFAAAAAALVAASSDLIAVYLAIEFLSLTSYVLAAFAKTDRRSGEAGLKYFLYGAACSAVMLYGMSILFGATEGSTSFSAIAGHLVGEASRSGAVWVGVMFTMVGLGFKLALVPFHFWAPDTYEGAPTPVTAFLSVVSKAAGVAAVVRFLVVVGVPGAPASLGWYWVLVVLTVLSMFYGNMVAIWQSNIKRMFAYSSIAQVGYLMIGVLTAMHTFGGQGMPTGPSAVLGSGAGEGGTMCMQGVLVYVFAYLLMNLGAFAIVIAVGKQLGSDAIEDYAGMIRRSPLFATSLTVFLLSLAGIPPTAGFLGKFLIFGGAIKVGVPAHPELVALAILGVINSVISAYYYLNVVRVMFFGASDASHDIRAGFGVNAAVIACLVLTLAVLVFAKPVTDLTERAVSTISVSARR